MFLMEFKVEIFLLPNWLKEISYKESEFIVSKLLVKPVVKKLGTTERWFASVFFGPGRQLFIFGIFIVQINSSFFSLITSHLLSHLAGRNVQY